MNQVSVVSPAVPPTFDRARKISFGMHFIFNICFCVTAALTVASTIMLLPSVPGGINEGDIAISFTGLGFPQRQMAVVALDITLIPWVFLLYHGRRVFFHFTKGEVFIPDVVQHVRGAGSWMLALFFAEIITHLVLITDGLIPHGNLRLDYWPAVMGWIIVVAGYVMAEAQRIAADSAEIV